MSLKLTLNKALMIVPLLTHSKQGLPLRPPVKELEYLPTMVRSHRGPGRSPNNPTRPLTQTDLHGVPLGEKDGEAFGHTLPKQPSHNCSIYTFQNIGPQPQYSNNRKAIFNSKSFSRCNASISLLAEHCLNERALQPSHLFSKRISQVSPKTSTYLFNNVTTPSPEPWNLTGGTGLIIDHSLSAHKTSHGADPTGLGRWSFRRI